MCALAIPTGVVLLFPHFTGWSYADFVAQTFGKHRLAFPITRNGRTFYYGRPDVAKSAQDLLDVIPKYARPGDKLFVGPTDLRKTPYSDAYLYYLLPEYAPGTYYIEMDPGVANAKGSRLPKDLAHSQLVVLSGRVERLVRAERLAQVRQRRSEQGAAPRLLPAGLVRQATRRQRAALRALDPQVPRALHRAPAPDGQAPTELRPDR